LNFFRAGPEPPSLTTLRFDPASPSSSISSSVASLSSVFPLNHAKGVMTRFLRPVRKDPDAARLRGSGCPPPLLFGPRREVRCEDDIPLAVPLSLDCTVFVVCGVKNLTIPANPVSDPRLMSAES